MNIIDKHLSPRFKSWTEYYRAIVRAARDKQTEHLLADPNTRLEIYEAENDTMYCNRLGWVKIQAFDETYEQLPTNDELHSNRKRMYMLNKFNPTLAQSFIDFLNALPTK